MTEQEFLDLVILHKKSGFNWRERRHEDWLENYTLYRDKVVYNRLTQRQSVNLPLMKSAIHTLMKDIDDAPLLYFESRDNDEQKEIFYNEYWKDMWAENRGTVKDVVDKKQVLLFGRSFKKLNIIDGMFKWEVIDPQDILVDRYVDPADLDTSRFLIHQHIYKPLSSLGTNPFFDKVAVKSLQDHYITAAGLLESEENAEDMAEKAQRMEAMGVPDMMTPELGESYVELNEAYIKVWDEDKERDILWYIVIADEREILLCEPLENVIGETEDHYWNYHFPYTSWGADVERTDFWNDAPADTLRTPNKIVNSWVSQLVENRTLRNFGMHYYNALDGFVPQTFEPQPWGWYPVPGKPDEVLKKVEVPDLSESLDELNFVIGVAEKAAAATATNQGQVEKAQVTLGEVQLALSNARERIKSFTIMYTEDWKSFGTKYIKLLEAAEDLLEGRRIYRKGRKTNKRIFSKYVSPKDWHSKLGYSCEVKQKTDRDQEQVEAIQKLQAAKQFMPMNQSLDMILKRKALELAGLNVDEMQKVIEEEQQNMKMLTEMNEQLGGGMPGDPAALPSGQPSGALPGPQQRPMIPAQVPTR